MSVQDIENETAVPVGYAKSWDHNVAYHRFVRRSVPASSTDLLDVGCGRGRLARELAGPGRHVLGLDHSAEMIGEAQAVNASVPGLTFRAGDFLTAEMAPDSFDFVCFLASLHHMDQARALTKAAEILRPGGRIVVIGLAYAATVPEELVSAVCAAGTWFNNLRPDHVDPAGIPLADPALSWHETRQLAREALPGAHFRRRLYFRYSLVWTKIKP